MGLIVLQMIKWVKYAKWLTLFRWVKSSDHERDTKVCVSFMNQIGYFIFGDSSNFIVSSLW